MPRELPNFDPQRTPQRTRIESNRVVPIDVFVESPPQGDYPRIGHMWWAMLLGFAGGQFARFVYWRRTRETQP